MRDMNEFIMFAGAVVAGNIIYNHIVSPYLKKKILEEQQKKAMFGLGETDYDPTHEFPVVMGPFGPEYMEGRVVTTRR